MKRIHLTIGSLLAISLAIGTAAAAPEPPEILAIRQLYTAAQKIRNDSSTKMIRRVQSVGGNGASAWRDPMATDADIVEEATLYKTPFGISSAHFKITPPSGDWAQRADYYYRADGSLAFLLSELRSFHGNVRQEKRSYFDSRGNVLRERENLFDLESGKPVKTDNFEREEVPVYKTTQDLGKELGDAYGKGKP